MPNEDPFRTHAGTDVTWCDAAILDEVIEIPRHDPSMPPHVIGILP